MPVGTSNSFPPPLPAGVFLLLDASTHAHPHGDFFLIQHHFVSYEFATEAQFLYCRLYIAPERLSVMIKELYNFN
ncbi:hypothetical protein AV530_011852 [Patagioenas fasciata monilis]|uniref:Uncharacterized protein n=1 Tax=Patagioenas fasciata monilis TaxID=372326 RepID=A0A1V4JTW6_PATFA|nr:hypothetical protein AV530_011852 [Patagioenas fasciata monilis]